MSVDCLPDRLRRRFAVCSAVALGLFTALFTGRPYAQPMPEAVHGLATYGSPALERGYDHLTHADPGARKGGRIRMGETGGFDSLNPYAPFGRAPWHLRFNTFETLMARSWGEPFSVYGLIAESVRVPEDRSYIEFTLRPEARFSNGAPITVEDVIWTWAKLRDEGKVGARRAYGKVAKAERTGERSVRFTFKETDRELPLIIGMMPVLPKDVYQEIDFSKGDLSIPVGSGPYIVEKVETGALIRYRKNPNYWGAKLPINAGRHNFDIIDHVYYKDTVTRFADFTTGAIDLFVEYDPNKWLDSYTFEAVRQGDILKSKVEHGRPSGMYGFVFNTRRPKFADRRVREAISLLLDFRYANDAFYRNAYVRMATPFSGSTLGHSGKAAGREAELLAPFASQLPKGLLRRGYKPSDGAGNRRNERNRRRALRLFAQAGWTIKDGVMRNASGDAFAFDILIKTSEQNARPGVFGGLLIEALDKIGVKARLRPVDAAEYTKQIFGYDFDMMSRYYAMSLSPGTEQRLYWGSDGRTKSGTRNYAGINDSAVDAMIDAMLNSESRSEFEAATRALDRVVSGGVYFIPFGHVPADLIAHRKELKRPANSVYGFVYIDTWWRED